jgi:hypothetical protein
LVRKHEPPIFSVEPAQSRFALSPSVGVHHVLPRTDQSVEVVGMDRGRPTATLNLLLREAHIIQIMLVDEISGSVGASRPCQYGNRVDDVVEIASTCPQRFLRAPAVIDVGQQPIPARDMTVRVSHRMGANLEPSIDAIGAAATMFYVVGSS